MAILVWENPEVAGSQIWAVGGLTDLGDVMLCPPPQKKHITSSVYDCTVEDVEHSNA